MFKFIVPAVDAPLPLSDFLRRQKVSLTLRRKLKRTPDIIRRNGQLIPWQTTVYPGDEILIDWPDDCALTPLPIPLSVIYEDDSLLVVDKPAGLLVHPTTDPSRDSLANAVIYYLRANCLTGGFHPIHRLDRNTSGLIALAKNPYIQHLFSVPAGTKLKRTYLAVIQGFMLPPSGMIAEAIGREPDSIIKRMVRADGQPAVTCYETIKSNEHGSLIKLRLQTGRTHQIRVHLAFTGHPIIGDDLYGGSREMIGRQALHASELSFIHPLTGRQINLLSPLPQDIVQLINKLDLSDQ